MKKIFFGCLSVALILTLNGCFSAPPPVDVTTINIPNPYVNLAPLTPDTYTVLGRISGTGEVSYNSGTGVYTGDTLKYGSLGDIGSIGHVSTVTKTGLYGIPTGTTTVVNTPSNSREMAIGNATYTLIEKARGMGADALIFVTTSVEANGDARTKTTTTKATVSGIAIKMK
jgi:uncharacterized protein YbjQ (UPF0145 family)